MALLMACSGQFTLAFQSRPRVPLRKPPSSSTRREMITASLLAGSIAGAIATGVAFPLDTVAIKSQQKAGGSSDDSDNDWSSQRLDSLFAGCQGVMVGESAIRAVAYTSNAVALTMLKDPTTGEEASSTAVLLAACTAGLACSFLVAPVERIKVEMQAYPYRYANEVDCLQSILRTEGCRGLQRGLGATLAREIPGYAIYFTVYSVLSSSLDLGALSPIVFGAMAGCFSWIPIYPLDVVKTTLILQPPTSTSSMMDVAGELYHRGGLGVFFQGLSPKLLRAAVNHATSFTVYEAIMSTLLGH